MRGPYTQLYLHLVWATWDRLPLITSELDARLYDCIFAKCLGLKCKPLAIGGIEDHVHLLARLHPTMAPATLVAEVKGVSSHLMTQVVQPGVFFKWQGGYGAFTLRKNDITIVSDYIANQKVHHARNSLVAEWETCELTDATPPGD